ncbi:hypothetical protein SH449x_001775 [Pirellulaceae bacterium SH449]
MASTDKSKTSTKANLFVLLSIMLSLGAVYLIREIGIRRQAASLQNEELSRAQDYEKQQKVDQAIQSATLACDWERTQSILLTHSEDRKVIRRLLESAIKNDCDELVGPILKKVPYSDAADESPLLSYAFTNNAGQQIIRTLLDAGFSLPSNEAARWFAKRKDFGIDLLKLSNGMVNGLDVGRYYSELPTEDRYVWNELITSFQEPYRAGMAIECFRRTISEKDISPLVPLLPYVSTFDLTQYLKSSIMTKRADRARYLMRQPKVLESLTAEECWALNELVPGASESFSPEANRAFLELSWQKAVVDLAKNRRIRNFYQLAKQQPELIQLPVQNQQTAIEVLFQAQCFYGVELLRRWGVPLTTKMKISEEYLFFQACLNEDEELLEEVFEDSGTAIAVFARRPQVWPWDEDRWLQDDEPLIPHSAVEHVLRRSKLEFAQVFVEKLGDQSTADLSGLIGDKDFRSDHVRFVLAAKLVSRQTARNSLDQGEKFIASLLTSGMSFREACEIEEVAQIVDRNLKALIKRALISGDESMAIEVLRRLKIDFLEKHQSTPSDKMASIAWNQLSNNPDGLYLAAWSHPQLINRLAVEGFLPTGNMIQKACDDARPDILQILLTNPKVVRDNRELLVRLTSIFKQNEAIHALLVKTVSP